MGKDRKGSLGFNQDGPKQSMWEEYVGKYVTISVPNLGNFSGLFKEFLEDEYYAVLNPVQTTRYDEKRGAVKMMVDEPRKVPLRDATPMLATRKSIEAYCTICNLEEEIRIYNLRQGAEMARAQRAEEKAKKPKKKSRKESRN